MRYDQIKALRPEQFRRLTGVKPATFEAMFAALKASWREFGRPPKLAWEDQLLLTLGYWREYRSLFHLAHEYGVSEVTVWRIIRRVEDTLTRSGEFTLPGKKALVQSDLAFEVILVDVSETPIERPKKSNDAITAARKSVTP